MTTYTVTLNAEDDEVDYEVEAGNAKEALDNAVAVYASLRGAARDLTSFVIVGTFAEDTYR